MLDLADYSIVMLKCIHSLYDGRVFLVCVTVEKWMLANKQTERDIFLSIKHWMEFGWGKKNIKWVKCKCCKTANRQKREIEKENGQIIYGNRVKVLLRKILNLFVQTWWVSAMRAREVFSYKTKYCTRVLSGFLENIPWCSMVWWQNQGSLCHIDE